MRSFLGLVGYYRKFVDNFASISAPLSDVTKKRQPNIIAWNDELERAFTVLKGKLCLGPILQLPDISKEGLMRATQVLVQHYSRKRLEKYFPFHMRVRNLMRPKRDIRLLKRNVLQIYGECKDLNPTFMVERKREAVVERLYVKDLLSQTELDSLLTQPKNVENKLESRFTMEVITSGKYRRLRIFSGKTDIPKDEDRWETWIEQAESQLDEWGDMSDSERKQKIREALRSPAAEVICDLRQDNPNATSEEYLAALELSFGCTQTGDELLMKFHNLKQKEQESPSDFIRRLQTSLRQVVRKGGIQREQANSTRLRQLLRGLLYDELVITTLQLSEKVEEPPKYLQLLNSLRRLEEEKESKQMQRRSRVAVKSATVEPRIAERLAELENQVKMFSFKQQERMEDNNPYIRPNPERVESKRDWMPSSGRRASPDFLF
ncbi:paraneoplastic antigen-like protein 5 [Anneissia japonica]|uniref:paraneoplastic antigen-like protein 5 n=1 Tax=Anneissia japonica TaxID=1529436 RepID=UPI00142591B8|nr:paraneoplastic antigen-like protein 5 [Anneissia japonica]